ncbi:right-handed parallel beta-helix repeat-containing protein [Micromonospora sp. ATA51]|uniref:right-handed parallel beta-helix repeat-containing protein n=1 Tax=Micromonospora sp. ATA51 TaxID=2806098 RepID=UPI001A3E8991|nr:right-handed parallel beta-helix repeat-containing protein [Micromonospora sp. ATA51]MBM0226032.1 right-handed parallel beta-helix repeat-containing protein [Micromonospora sp. ATA51]
MHKRPFAGLTALALAGGTLLGTAAPAQAADPTVLYVKQTATACSDTGPGTVEQPFCTIGAAAAVVTAGQTVDVGGGNYRERVTIANSGTPDQPIVFRSGSSNSNASLIGPTAGFAITSQHDIRIERFQATGSVAVPALDIRDASHIEVENGTFTVSDNATVPAVRLAGVTQSSLKRGYIGGRTLDAGVTMDAATTGVSLISLNLTGRTWYDSADRSVGVRVAGPGNTILNNTVDGFGGAAISVEAGATDTVVVNNQITGSFGYGIHNHGATGTAITNNTVKGHCLDGIRVDGTSAKVSVQNNLLAAYNPLNTNSCGPSASGRVELGIYDAAVGDTAVDYNNADDYYSSSPATYAWNGSRMGLSAFRAASGQAAHDLETGDPRDAYDSANSAAPGYQATDRVGRARADDRPGRTPVPAR